LADRWQEPQPDRPDRDTPEQIIRKLREADRPLAEGGEVADVARHLEVSEQTYHVWRNHFGGPLSDPPPCDPARPGSAGFFMSFREAPPPSPLAASFVDLPATLPHDGVAHLVVRLHNPGDQPFPLSPCPTIAVRVYDGDSETGAGAHHRFNCAGAPADIGPGGSLDFAVELEADGMISVDFTDAEGSAATASADARLE
jgi:hypothetical protein